MGNGIRCLRISDTVHAVYTCARVMCVRASVAAQRLPLNCGRGRHAIYHHTVHTKHSGLRRSCWMCITAVHVVQHCRLAALVLWIGWRGITNMARTCKKFRHWLEWSCLRCGLAYRLVHRKWYTGLQTWCYNERVIAASLCTTCHEQEMQRMEAGYCRFCGVWMLKVHVHDGQVCADRWGTPNQRRPRWRRDVLDTVHNAGETHGRTGP